MEKILNSINSPDDLKKLNIDKLYKLSSEITDFLVENVSKTGGHLSPNLGIIELTIAIHRVFDTSDDRLIFDVGHQSYVHKLLTGRRDQFNTLRKKDGLSGFTKPSESIHDAFISGHASISISVAQGMSHARTLRNEKHNVIAVIGDGALTGGMAYEALNSAGNTNEPLIVILNDNHMSITRNVGAISKHLLSLRTNNNYIETKRNLESFLKRSKPGTKALGVISNVKDKVKFALLQTSFFEQMGFVYLGPIDGHNIEELEKTLIKAKELKKPVFIHVITKKGKGYKYSEKSPELFHGISEFDLKTGKTISNSDNNFSKNFGDTIVKIAKQNRSVCAITAAMSSGTGLLKFKSIFPTRFFDVGIAEEHAITMSAGLAKGGETPVVAIYSTFLQRAYDQLIHDISILKLHVVLAIDRAGIVGDDGETHNGVFDVPMLLSIPNFDIFAPSNYIEQEKMLNFAINKMNSPVAVRYPRGVQGDFLEDTSNNDFKVFNENGKVCVITYGTLINNVYPLINNDICVIKINRLTLDLSVLLPYIKNSVIIVEDCVNTGSLGQKIGSFLLENNIKLNYFKLLNTGDKFTKQAKISQAQQICKISKQDIELYIKEALELG